MTIEAGGHSLSSKEKFKILLKQAAVSAAMTVVPGHISFLIEVGQKAYELWCTSTIEERCNYQRTARELNAAEVDMISAEIARDTGVSDRRVIDIVMKSIQGMNRTDNAEALRSINQNLTLVTQGQGRVTPHAQAHRAASAKGFRAPRRPH